MYNIYITQCSVVIIWYTSPLSHNKRENVLPSHDPDCRKSTDQSRWLVEIIFHQCTHTTKCSILVWSGLNSGHCCLFLPLYSKLNVSATIKLWNTLGKNRVWTESITCVHSLRTACLSTSVYIEANLHYHFIVRKRLFKKNHCNQGESCFLIKCNVVLRCLTNQICSNLIKCRLSKSAGLSRLSAFWHPFQSKLKGRHKDEHSPSKVFRPPEPTLLKV